MEENKKRDYSYQTKIYNPELYKRNLTPYPVVETLDEWLENEVSQVKNRSIRWLSEMYFHRKEMRATFIDNSYFFTPADGVITNVNSKIDAHNPLVEVKGVEFSLADLLQDDDIEGDWLVITVFMTFFSDHHNHIPYAGNRTWEDLPPMQTYNLPMLAMEKALLRGVVNPEFEGNYLKKNGRRVSTIYSPVLDLEYKVIQIGDYDVDTIVDFQQIDGSKTMFFNQNANFGKIQYGSSAVLAIPLLEGGYKMKLRPEAQVGNVVKCKRTPLVTVCWNEQYAPGEVQKISEE